MPRQLSRRVESFFTEKVTNESLIYLLTSDYSASRVRNGRA